MLKLGGNREGNSQLKKNAMKFIYFLFALTLFSVFSPEESYASFNDLPIVVPEENQMILSEDVADSYINKLEEYVIFNEDNTLTLDSDYVELGIPVDFTNSIEEGLDNLNTMIRSNQVIVDTDLNVTLVGSFANNSMMMSARAKGCGRSGHDLYWWGYNIFLDCNETRSTYQSFMAGGAATAGIASISRFIPVPPTQLASAIAGAIGGGLVGFGKMIKDEHQGHGVRLRFTGLGYAAVPTGVFPQ